MWRLPVEYLPAVLLTVAVAGVLGWLRLAPVTGGAVAAVFPPTRTPAGAIGRLDAGWRILGITAVGPLPVLLLRPSPGVSPPLSGAWLVLRASGAAQCASSQGS